MSNAQYSLKTAIVISTYNNPLFLKICLESLLLQNDFDFHVYIADDGSTDATRKMIQEIKLKFHHPLHYYWHEDKGYRKALIHNTVFKELHDFDIVISMDGDTFVHASFVSDHKRIHSQTPGKNTLFMGRRVDLNKNLTQEIFKSGPEFFLKNLTWKKYQYWWTKELDSLSKTFRIQNRFLQKILKRDRVYDLLGSNFSISKELLFKINGYNEDFNSYWGEDGELFVRARNAQAHIIGLKSFALQFHLYHTRREPDPKVQDYYFNTLLKDQNYQYCPNGIQKNNPLK